VDVDDLAIVQVRTERGAVGVIEASRLATGVQDELRFEIHGSKGAIAFNLMDPNWLTVYDATVPEGPLGGSRGPQRIECVTATRSPTRSAQRRTPSAGRSSTSTASTTSSPPSPAVRPRSHVRRRSRRQPLRRRLPV